MEVKDKDDILDDRLFANNDYQLFIKQISDYPTATLESNNENFLKYRQTGEKQYFDMLVISNVRYVISIAMRYSKHLSNLNIMNVINSGILGLIQAIKCYDPDKGALSTYATSFIKKSILSKIYALENIIHKPDYMRTLINKYLKLMEKEDRLLDEDICEELQISPKTLALLRDALNTKAKSLDEKINDDKSELVAFVADKIDYYNGVINSYDSDNLKIVLKHILSNIQYFVIYYRYLSEDKKTLEEIARLFTITGERVRQIEEKALKKIKPYLDSNSNLYRNTLAKIQQNEGDNFKYLESKPLSPRKIVTYLYLKEKLSSDEISLYEQIVFGKYVPKPIILSKILNMEPKQIKDLSDSINRKKKVNNTNVESFSHFQKQIILSYKTKILSINDQIDYGYLLDQYGSLSCEEILDLFSRVDYNLSDKEKQLLEAYFGKPSNSFVDDFEIERVVNVLKFDYRKKEGHASLDKLYTEYLRIKDDFAHHQQLYLECFFFGKKNKKEFFKKYPNYLREYDYRKVIIRLERSYYHIYGYFEKTFTKEMWERVRNKYQNRFTPFKLHILDMEFGTNGKKYSREEMADILGLDRDKLSHDIHAIIQYANSLYLGMSNRIDINKSIYAPYILDKSYEFTPENRKVLNLFIIQNKTYEEISSIMGLSQSRISDIINNGIRKIDSYRFGIINRIVVSSEELDAFLAYYKGFSDIQKQIIKLKYLEYLENSLIANKLGVELKYVNVTVSKFNDLYYGYMVKDVDISENDLIQQVSMHISESLLNEKEKKIISSLLGIKNSYNPDGRKLNRKELIDELSISNDSLKNSLQKIKYYVKGYKFGLKKADNVFIERDKLNILLDDVHLPISDKEREIICYIFALKGFPYKTFDDLSQHYGENAGSIRVRYQRAILNIYKYINGEIDGEINYEADILPVLKYFSTSDREKINDFYRDNLSYEEMAIKYHVSIGKISWLIERVNANIHELNCNPCAKRFDFDYYLEAIRNPNLPFYGDLDVAIKLFDLTFGMNGHERSNAAEAVKALNLDIELSTAERTINSLMLAVCKLKDGITKEKCFKKEEISEYYRENYANIPECHRQYYEHYLQRMSDPRIVNGHENNLSYIVINDLIKEKYSDAFVMKKATREEILDILHKYRNDIARRIRDELMNRFDIMEREFMNGRHLNHIYKLLYKLDTLLKDNDGQLVRKIS